MSSKSYFTILFLGLMFFIYMYLKKLDKEKGEELEKKIKKSHFFNATKKISNYNNSQMMAIDERRQKINFINLKNKTKSWNFKDILEVELLENGKSIITTSGASMVGRAIVGGIALGGLGAAVGGVTSKKEQEDVITEISLKFIINNINNSIFIFTFFQSDTGIKKDSPEYIKWTEEARKWYGILKVIIKNIKEKSSKNNDNKSYNTAFGVDKVKYLENAIGTEELYSQTTNNYNFTKEEKNILIEASINLKKDKLNQSLIDKAYRILSKYNTSNDQKKDVKIEKVVMKNNNNFSLADEILKLKSLKDEGILSEEEFINQKNKLLNN